MDPLTLGLSVLDRSLELVNKIYDDTPKEIRVENIKDWYDFLADIKDFVKQAKEEGGDKT